MIKKLIALLTITIVAIGFCGCTEEKTTTTDSINKETAKESIKITDALGREVEVPKEVNKIVCYGPGASRLAVYLNATDKICGITMVEKKYWKGMPYIIAHKKLLQNPKIGSGRSGEELYAEKIIETKPDVIFITYMSKENAENIQQKTGIPVVVLSYGTLATYNNEELFKSLRIMGKVLDKEERAEEVIKFIKDCQNDLKERTKDISDENKPTVYIGGVRSKMGILSTCPKYPPFVSVNAKNVADELNGSSPVVINKEKLLDWNPDVIFIDEAIFRVGNDYEKNKEFYNSLKAFKNGNVYGILPYNFYMTNIGTSLADSYYIGKVLYPEQFEDIDPKKKANEIYTFLVGKPVYNNMAEEFGGFKKLKLE